MQPIRYFLRRPKPANAHDSSSSPPPHHHHLPKVQTPEQAAPPRPLPLPSALMPPKKRRVLRAPRKAASPIPPPLSAPAPPIPATAEALAMTTPSPPPLAADVGPSTPPSTAAGAGPSTRSIPAADAKPSTLLPAPDAAAKPAAARKVRKIIKKVIIRKIVPKGTFAARKAAAAAAAAAGASKPGGETPTDKPANDHIAATDDAVRKEQDVKGAVVEKPATDCNAVAVEEALGEDTVVEETLSGRPVTDCDGHMGEEVGMSERQKRQMTEVFVGGLHRDAKEKDVRAVLAKVGEITEVRMIMDPRTGKNKGYCFVRYHDAAQAKKAIAEFGKVKVCGKLCRVAALDGNGKIFLGNIDKKWKKDVKSIFVEGIPTSWDQAKLTEIFKKFGTIESVVLSCDIQSTKRKDFAFINYMTHEAAFLCLESFDKEELTENGSKVNINVSLAKPVQKGKQNKEDHKFSISEKGKTVAQSVRKVGPSSVQIMPSRVVQTTGYKKSSTTHDLLHVLREQASWRDGHIGLVSDPIQDHPHIYSGEKRPFSTLDDDSSYPMRGHSRPHHESSAHTMATSSYGVLPPAITRSSPPYYDDNSRYPEGLASYYGVTRPSISGQACSLIPSSYKSPPPSEPMMQAGSRQPEQLKGGRYYPKY